MSRNLRIAGIVLGTGVVGAYFAPNFFNPTRTTAVKSIEDRYTSGGATPGGERGQATKRGDGESTYTEAETRNQERLREQKADLLGS
ncbi:MAG: hypothetical protein GOMPHAMPRED_000993 [Gomphillus americanus]|uniref:Uncharacterized protein n=1 Tax=Gomphillus americanus TaxID=1940652 RepID=A0A8H3EZH4_9LECA|nr:MAG: hypothetical protein GOMPHAMPRED_000993 [Gomphillus americanus]